MTQEPTEYNLGFAYGAGDIAGMTATAQSSASQSKK